MGRVSTAFRAFFGALFDRGTADRVQQALAKDRPDLLEQKPPTRSLPAQKSVVVPLPPPKPRQSEAVTLLSALQREARLVDFLMEDLSGYSDDQVGAAVREIHRDSGLVLKRFFAIRPILSDDEGAVVNVATGFDAARYRLTGKLSGEAPYQGTLRHHGWEVIQCELPAFTGNDSAAKTIAPAEVEILNVG